MKLHSAVVVALMVLAAAASASPCCAQGSADDEEFLPRRYVGLVLWLPLDSDIWDSGYGIRYLDVEKQTYLTGVIGVAQPELVGLQRGDELRLATDRKFAGVGFGVNLTRPEADRAFVGIGLTLYWTEGGPGGEGWVYVDGLGRNLGPSQGNTLYVSPELTAHFRVSSRVGLYVCANLSSDGQPPRHGIFLGLSYEK